MTDEQKKKLERQLWNIANELRGRMDADEFRDYILGFIFYKYLSERLHIYADSILKQDGLVFADLDPKKAGDFGVLEAVEDACIEALGYYLKPDELFSAVSKKGAQPGSFILDDLTTILNNIQNSTMGTASEDDFDNLFEDLDLTSTKLGRTNKARNDVIAKVLVHLDDIDFQLEEADSDVLGDAYEYLIGKFASGAGKTAGEFYTPQQVSTILARIVTTGKTRLRSAYDPTCGSGSLLLRVAKEVKNVEDFFGQERNRTTYNLARMNMILHGVHYRNFDIRQEDTLEHPQHLGLLAEAIVANPPFSAKWSANKIFESDDRFSEYGKLAPSSKADFAFIQHMLHHLDDDGIMAVVVPHGALFRGRAEGVIREFIVRRNWLDAVIGLPENIFYGTEIPTAILVFRKCKETNDVLFIDGSQCYERGNGQHIIRETDINTIVRAYRDRREKRGFSVKVYPDTIAEQEFNLNIPRYVDTFTPSEELDLNHLYSQSSELHSATELLDKRLRLLCDELGVHMPQVTNVALLKRFKSGLKRQVFGQKIRFKREDGSDFPAWTPCKLGDIFENSREKGSHGLPIHSVTQDLGLIARDTLDRHMGDNASDDDNLVVRPGDIVYNTMRMWQGAVAMSDTLCGVSPAYVVLRSRGEDDPRFFLFWFKEERMLHALWSYSYGLTNDRLRLYYADFAKVPAARPQREEQVKIADFFSCIDAKIAISTAPVDEAIRVAMKTQRQFQGYDLDHVAI